MTGRSLSPTGRAFRYQGGVPTSRWCPRCSRWKSLDRFARNLNARHGVDGWCKPCKALKDRERRGVVS